jgi:hypothetical protein
MLDATEVDTTEKIVELRVASLHHSKLKLYTAALRHHKITEQGL